MLFVFVSEYQIYNQKSLLSTIKLTKFSIRVVDLWKENGEEGKNSWELTLRKGCRVACIR